MKHSFIPANETKPVIWFFYQYTRYLLWRRFKKVQVHQDYHPEPNRSTVYFINHHFWWDGLLPLYLNEGRFHQNARALMEDKQMREFPFFARIGAFSINLEDPRSAITSLRYALDSINRPNSCLFIYPEGKIMPVSFQKPEFKSGLGWLYERCTDVDFVPIAFYIDHTNDSKPDLHIQIGEPAVPVSGLDKNELNTFFEEKLHEEMIKIRNRIYQVRS